MKKRNYLGGIALLLLGAFFGAVLISGFSQHRPEYDNIQIGSSHPPIQNVNVDAQAFNNAFVEVAEKVTKSIVQITVVSRSESKGEIPEQFRFFFPFRDESPQERMGSGSGVIISEDGYILTNNHVVENATDVRVGMLDKREYKATVVGTDPLTDLAVIKVDAKDLPAAYLGNSDDVKVGQWVMAIGNPMSLASTVTAGIVSATSRDLNIIRDKDNYGIEDFIQTDAAINPGNSGGALVDLTGSVIGINSAIATNGMTGSYIGYGFAIPINIAKSVAKDLIAEGKVRRGYIGVGITEVDAATAKAVGLDSPKGIMIQNVVEDGAASKTDIKPGDIILKIDGREVNKPNELQGYVASKRAGYKIELDIYRDGKTFKREVNLKARNKEDDVEVKQTVSKEKQKSKDEMEEIKFENVGLTARNLTEQEIKNYKVENGVLITEVKSYSEAFNKRLSSGLVIVEVDKKKIDSVSELEKIFENKRGDAVLLKVVTKDESTRFVGLEISK